MNILILDDEPFALKLLARQLAALGFDQITPCSRGSNALEFIESADNPVDLVICDLQMPEMDGVEFIRHLVRLGYGGALALISGEDGRILQTARMLAAAHHLNVLGALHKPVSPEALGQLLRSGPRQNAPTEPPADKTYAPDELLWAIAEGQLVNYYQPKVTLDSGQLIGVETLVRWQHPEDGLVLPQQFIRMAEEHELIDDLTRTVLAGALDQARCWREAGLVLQVAVNISMDNLATLDFPDYVDRMMERARIPRAGLALEVSEVGLMRDPMASLDILTRLHLKHIYLSIDDFGSRDASLTQLRNIPFDELKINRTVIHGAARDPSLGAMVVASLGLARQLGMKAVAEGVENREDWEFVRNSGCDIAQGYFIARPMPAAGLMNWLADWEDRQRDLASPFD